MIQLIKFCLTVSIFLIFARSFRGYRPFQRFYTFCEFIASGISFFSINHFSVIIIRESVYLIYLKSRRAIPCINVKHNRYNSLSHRHECNARKIVSTFVYLTHCKITYIAPFCVTRSLFSWDLPILDNIVERYSRCSAIIDL